MQKETRSKPIRKIVRKTQVEVLYDFSKKKHQEWARLRNKKLTDKGYELEDFEPGRATYIKQTIYKKE